MAKCTGLEVFPKQVVLEGKNATQQITVRATYSDGSDRDVTNLALFMSNNDPTAAITKEGLVTSGDRGAAFMLARFDVYSTVAQVLVIPDKLQYTRPQLTEANYIDTNVNEKLHKLRIIPSEVCTDQEFIRRLYIDVAGIYPSPDDTRQFLAPPSAPNTDTLVDALPSRTEFPHIWVCTFANLLQYLPATTHTCPTSHTHATTHPTTPTPPTRREITNTGLLPWTRTPSRRSPRCSTRPPSGHAA